MPFWGINLWCIKKAYTLVGGIKLGHKMAYAPIWCIRPGHKKVYAPSWGIKLWGIEWYIPWLWALKWGIKWHMHPIRVCLRHKKGYMHHVGICTFSVRATIFVIFKIKDLSESLFHVYSCILVRPLILVTNLAPLFVKQYGE